jgi:hypothetical protein
MELSESDYRPPAPVMFVSHAYEADALQFVKLPAGWVGNGIHPPIALFALFAVQQSWVKRRAIGIAPQPAQSSLVFPSPVTKSFASVAPKSNRGRLRRESGLRSTVIFPAGRVLFRAIEGPGPLLDLRHD